MTEDLGYKAKKALEEFLPVIDGKLEKYWDQEKLLDFGFNQKQKDLVREILIHAEEHNMRKAKRVRAAFVYSGYTLGKGKADERLWKAVMSVELVHTALLMHDDFMDEDDIRRGGETTHKFYERKPWGNRHYGETMAVSVGDGVLCMGFELLNNCRFDPERVNGAMNQLLRGITNTAWGQAYDVTLEAMKEWTQDDVIALHKAKTAIYTYENPLFIGAHLAGLPKEAFDILHEYSMDGGVAFQLQDDILGVFGSEQKTGKSADSDLKQGKCTLLIKRVFDTGTKDQIKAVEKVWGNQKATEEELKSAKKSILESGAYEYNKQMAKEYAARAAKTAGRLRVLELDNEAIDYIQGIAEYMVKRDL